MSIVPSPRSEHVSTGTTMARAAAASIAEAVAAHRLAPIVSVDANFDVVLLDVRPERSSVWRTWCNLLQVDDARTTWRGQFVTAHGVWDGVHVVLTGLDAPRWSRETLGGAE